MQKASYMVIQTRELLTRMQGLKGAGVRFVQMHAERNADGERFDIVYTFVDVEGSYVRTQSGGDYDVLNIVLEGINSYDAIPSISEYYPAVFPFENEAHDLFGLHFTDMKVDFEGYFYHVAVDAPMSIISPEVKAAREKQAKLRAAKEAKAKKAAAEAAAKAAAEGGEAVPAKPAEGNDAVHDDAEAKRALKAAEMEAKLAAMDPEKAAKVRAALAAKEAKAKAAAEAAQADAAEASAPVKEAE